MKHGNQKYDFTPLEIIGHAIEVKSANVYALKTRLRQEGYKKKNVKIEEISSGYFIITRIA